MDVERLGIRVAAAYSATGGDGPVRDRVWPALHVADAETVVEKTAYSDFFPGACPLHERLAARGIDTVLVAGTTTTTMCCEAMVRDAQPAAIACLWWPTPVRP